MKRFLKISHRELFSAIADRILFELFANLNNLAVDSWKPTYKKYKYISSLPSGPYKSIQMVLSSIENDCGKDYMVKLENSLY